MRHAQSERSARGASAEPFRFDGGPRGVLLLHGFCGTPFVMRGLVNVPRTLILRSCLLIKPGILSNPEGIQSRRRPITE